MRLPAEYEPQRAMWLTWPGNPGTWPRHRQALERDYAHFAAEISRRQPVELICPEVWRAAAETALRKAGADQDHITAHPWPVNDAWCRDHGPVFVKDGVQSAIVDFRFNAWGGKFDAWQDDDAIPRRVSDHRNLPRHPVPIAGEGGALEVNSSGVLITTESVWLNTNRNPGLTRAEAETVFTGFLGVSETVWLPDGLIGDDTDGHIDTLTRFVDDHTVVTVLPGTDDPNHRAMHRNTDLLRERFEVVALPHPAPMQNRAKEPLPATYANFLILNDAVLVPTYAQPKRDDHALGLLRDLYPNRDVIGMPSETFIQEGGGPHCLSMQEPLQTG